jgi:CRISPR-associated protein Cas2
MIVVIANYLPSVVRGKMKLWFVEPRPNVFVSGIKDSTADGVINYLYEHCPIKSGLMVFKRIGNSPGYEIRSLGELKRSIVEINGLQLIQEDKIDEPTI